MPHLPGPIAWRRRLGQLSTLACALAAASACLAMPGAAWADSTTLTTDSGGLPLVSAAKLSPGHLVERCIVITTPTVYASADLAMYVTTEGDLATHLNVTVESGQGGGFAGCSGFSGRLVYVGTLAALASGFNAQNPQRVGHYSPTVSSTTLRLRFAVQDDNAAQGLTTKAAFWWLPIAPDTTPAPGPTTTLPPPPSAVPTTLEPSTAPASSQPTPALATSSHEVPPAPASRTTTPATRPPTGLPTTAKPRPVRSLPEPPVTSLAPPVGVPFSTGDGKKSAVPLARPGGGGDDGTSAGDLLGALATGLGTGVASVAHTVSIAAAPVLRGAAYTSLLIIPLALLFLLVQRVIDRRDPKLALAPSYGDPFLGFVDRGRLAHPQGDA